MHSGHFSRTSSAGSIDNMMSPTSGHRSTDCSPTTEEEDSDQKSAVSYRERRREAHTQAEQKRRDAIKKGYEDLQHLVPKCQQQDSVSSYKLSKASILQRSIDYIQLLQHQNKDLDDRRQALSKEMIALQIMRKNYEEIVKNHQHTQPGQSVSQVSDEVKMKVFQALCDRLFQSFDESVPTSNFHELSRGIFSWLEEACKPQTLKHITGSVLDQLDKQQQHQHQ
jgi:MAX-like protein X